MTWWVWLLLGLVVGLFVVAVGTFLDRASRLRDEPSAPRVRIEGRR